MKNNKASENAPEDGKDYNNSGPPDPKNDHLNGD